VLERLDLPSDEFEELGVAEPVDLLVEADECSLHQHVQDERKLVTSVWLGGFDQADVFQLAFGEVDAVGLLEDL